jgi:hypothetical protein
MSGRASASQRRPTPSLPSSSSASAIRTRSPFPRARAREGRHGDRPRRQLVLHVRRPTAPDVAGLVDMAGERRMRPAVRIVGRYHVRMAEERQRRPGAPAADAGDQVGPAGVAGDQLTLDTVRLEVAREQAGRRRLAARRVARVDPQQVAQKGGRLVAKLALGRQVHRARISRSPTPGAARSIRRSASARSTCLATADRAITGSHRTRPTRVTAILRA